MRDDASIDTRRDADGLAVAAAPRFAIKRRALHTGLPLRQRTKLPQIRLAR